MALVAEQQDDADVLIPVQPYRDQDRELITQWIAARSGQAPEPITDYIIYQHNGNIPPSKHWTPPTCEKARLKVRSLALRSQVPLAQLGLLPSGGFTQDSLRAPIVAYARDFEYRNRARVADLLTKLGPMAAQLKGPLVWRTKSWWYFVTYGKEFFNWLERRGLRPKGSNPFVGISKPTPKQIHETIIVAQWFHRMMTAKLSPKEEAVIMLLANGLRSAEVSNIMISDLSLQDKTVRVLGKGNKLRTVTLYYRTMRALDRYFAWRKMDTRPFLFPHNTWRVLDRPANPTMPRTLVQKVAARVFDDPTIIARITPHKFRHWFISDWLQRGGNSTALKLQVGHCSVAMLERYQHMDPSWLSDEAQRMDPDLPTEVRNAIATDLLAKQYPRSNPEPVLLPVNAGPNWPRPLADWQRPPDKPRLVPARVRGLRQIRRAYWPPDHSPVLHPEDAYVRYLRSQR